MIYIYLLAMGPFSFFFFIISFFLKRNGAGDLISMETGHGKRSSEAATYDASPPSYLLYTRRDKVYYCIISSFSRFFVLSSRNHREAPALL